MKLTCDLPLPHGRGSDHPSRDREGAVKTGGTRPKNCRGGKMRMRSVLFLILNLMPIGWVAAQSSTTDPVTVAYYYKVKWGYQDEFLELFKRNHYPLLEAQVKSGRLVRVEAFTP